jgi:hypothetical protein
MAAHSTEKQQYTSKKEMMKTARYIVSIIVFATLQLSVMAQPLPPSSPSGNPVPVEGIVALLLASMAGLGITRLRKKKRK